MCCLFSLVDSRLDLCLMMPILGTTNEATPSRGKYFFSPSYRNVGPPYIATLSLPGLTIGLPVWLFSTPVILNAASASVVSTSTKEHQPHFDPLTSSPSSLARSASISYSSSSESSEASNLVDKKKNKMKDQHEVDALGGKCLQPKHLLDSRLPKWKKTIPTIQL